MDYLWIMPPPGTVDRDLFWRRQFLNPFAFEGAPEALSALVE
jgi:serine/threonine-protein kinase HipA